MTFFESDMTECPVELSLRVINRKWVLQIIRDMFFGKKRFSEFKEGKPDLTNKALSRCLKFMETENLIEKITDKENKKNTHYILTEKGKSLNQLIYDLVIFTLDNDNDPSHFSEETKNNTKKIFREKLELN
ncbi:MAG: helix-turn-helix transcriptional regulator [Methanosphaera sp.]|nr:helix-turn-helix transcriptional regulator [Methanosphaera sp.]